MDFFRRFTFLVCAPAFEAEDLEGLRLGQITVAIEQLGFQGRVFIPLQHVKKILSGTQHFIRIPYG